MTKHTQGPWKVIPAGYSTKPKTLYVVSEGSDSRHIAEIDFGFQKMSGGYDEINKANAEFIVRACNSHYELLEALKGMLAICPAQNQGEIPSGWPHRARSLIKRIEGQQ